MSSPTLRWLADQSQRLYPDAQLVYALVSALLAAVPTLRPRSDVYTYDDGRTQLLLCIHGLLPITYRAVTYHIPVALWLPRGFPAKEPPLVYVVPTQDMLIRPANHLDLSGRVHDLPTLDRWTTKPEGATLVSTVQDLQTLFSTQPPLYAKPKQTDQQKSSDVQAIRPIQEPQPGPSSAPPVPSRPPAFLSGPATQPIQSGPIPYHLQHQYPSVQPAHALSSQSQSQSPIPSQPQSHNSTPPPPPPPPPYPHHYTQQHQSQTPPVQISTPPVPPASVGPSSTSATPAISASTASTAPPPPPRPADYPYSYGSPSPNLAPHLSHTAAAIAPKPVPVVSQGPPSAPPPLPVSPYHPSNSQVIHTQIYPGVSPLPASSSQPTPPPVPTSTTYNAVSRSPPPPALPPPIIAPAPVIAAANTVSMIPNLMDDPPSASTQYALAPSASTPLASQPNAPSPVPPPRPLNPYTHTLHTTLHTKLRDAMQVLVYQMHGPDNSINSDPNAPPSDLPSRPSTRTSLLNTQHDLLTGSSAIADEIARLRAVRDVCLAVSSRLRESVTRAEGWVTNVRGRWANDRDRRYSQSQYGGVSPGRSPEDGADQVASVDPPVDELLVAGSIVHNQLINLVAEDNAIEDTIYHLHRALNAGRLDLERFLRTTRLLAEEQYAKRALIEKILRGLGQAPVTGPGFPSSGVGNGLSSVDSRIPVR